MISTAVKPSLSFFCRYGFKEIALLPWPGLSCISSPISHTHAKQATLHTAFTARRPGSTALQVLNLLRRRVGYHEGSTPIHNSRSPRVQGRILHAIGGRPTAAGSGQVRAYHQHPPQTGRKKQAPMASQLCPLKDF